jgi:hypothetical protein
MDEGIADCQLPIAYLKTVNPTKIGNRQLAIGNT